MICIIIEETVSLQDKMNFKKRNLLKVLFFTAVVLLATACETYPDVRSQRVAVLLPDASIVDRWAIDRQNLETVMDKYGFNTTFYIAPETAEGAVQQVEQLRDAIKNGAKYIVLTAIDYKKINESGLLALNPDLVLAANDNLAQGAIEALTAAGITDMPVITGQDNTTMAQANIKSHKQTMTIDKNLKDMAYNTGLIINSLISNSPVQTSQHISGIPVLYSKITLMTIDSY